MSIHRPLRVTHLTAVHSSNYYLNGLCDFADTARVEYSALSLLDEGTFVAHLRDRGVEAHALGCQARSSYPTALLRIAAFVRRRRIDVLHAHLFEPSLLAAAVSRATGCVLVTTRHHSDAVHRLSSPSRRRLYSALEAIVNRTATRIIAPATSVRETLVGIERVPVEKVCLVPYPQHRGRYESITAAMIRAVESELGLGKRPTLTCVARLHPEKGHSHLLEAFAGLLKKDRQATLLLLGEGALEGEVRRQIARLGIDSTVRLLGWRDDALAVIAASDLLVHPSLHEALPSAVIEAVALGKPVLATDVSGVRDILGDGRYGVIVPPGRSAALLEGMEAILGDLAAAQRRAADGREFVFETMSAEKISAKHIDCYEEAVRDARRASTRS